MRKLISIVLALVLVFGLTTLTVSAEDPVLAGNDVIDRPNGPDSWTDFYLADGNNVFMEDSVMTGFSAFVGRLSPFKFMVFTKVEEVWEVVYESELVEPAAEDLDLVYTAEISPAVFVPAGSVVGLYYPTNGAIPYTIDDDEGDVHFEYDVVTRPVLFTDNTNGPEFVDFYNSGDRIYSIQALGFAAPESGWLTPLFKEAYKMNFKSTLPIKFRLDGEFEDVKLMVNDVEVPIDLKECEEDGDFYMGLFRPTEPGEYTATVLVNGAPVLTKEFTAFDNAAKVKAQEKVKVIKGLAKGKNK